MGDNQQLLIGGAGVHDLQGTESSPPAVGERSIASGVPEIIDLLGSGCAMGSALNSRGTLVISEGQQLIRNKADESMGKLTWENVGSLSDLDKKALLQNASPEAINRLISKDPDDALTFQILFSAVTPKDVFLTAKCLKCIENWPNLQHLKASLLSKINEYIGKLTLPDVEKSSDLDKKALLQNASPEAINRLIRKGTIGQQIFNFSFSAENPQDTLLAAKYLRHVDSWPDLKSKFLGEINEHIDNLTFQDIKGLSDLDRRTLLQNASPEAIGKLIGKGVAGQQAFLALFGALSPKDGALHGQYLQNADAILKPFTDAVSGTCSATKLEDKQRWFASALARSCFNEKGEIDLEKAKLLQAGLKCTTFLRTASFLQSIPNIEFMKAQMLCVVDNLVEHAEREGSLLNTLNEANRLQSSDFTANGNHLKNTMNQGQQDLNQDQQGGGYMILTSLFLPHRQMSLPTCTIDSILNAEIRNHPDQLAKMYKQMLTSDTFNLPSEYLIHQQSINTSGSFISVNLSQGSEAARKDPALREQQYVNVPVGNLNDVFFANFFQASEFGNANLTSQHTSGEYGTMYMFQGISRDPHSYSSSIEINNRDFESGIEALKMQARQQKEHGLRYMRVATTSGNGARDESHAENIDIEALLKLDLGALEDGKPYIIGDRNWDLYGAPGHEDLERRTPGYLAIKKTTNPSPRKPTYSFQTVTSNGTPLPTPQPADNIKLFAVYSTEVNKLHEPRPAAAEPPTLKPAAPEPPTPE
ncbi:MAG: hypothetical protein LBJ94_03775 [Puniceicoccales bacterium]|jgi:hypothetical protein|nr:hypothetical protein [Puniceicoccales bacterium]